MNTRPMLRVRRGLRGASCAPTVPTRAQPYVRTLARQLAVLLTLVLISFTAGRATAAPAVVQPEMYATTTAALNLQTEPSIDSATLLVLPVGAQVYVNAGLLNGVWYDVTYDGTNGYVQSGGLVPSMTPPVRTGAYSVTTTELELHFRPGPSNRVLLLIPVGARVFVSTGPYNGEWFQVTYKDVTGYVQGSYLSQGRSTVITKLTSVEPIVALTFDAGSDVGYTAQILDTLAANGVKASFGMTGPWSKANPDLLRRMVEDGHTIINHTYTHSSFTGHSTGAPALSYTQRWNELRSTERELSRITGTNSKPYFRPPYGDYDDSVLADVYSCGYSYTIMWSVDSLGWQGLSQDQILQRVLNGLEPGAIYLFHVGSQSQDGPTLQRIIDALQVRGYRFAAIRDFYR